MAYLPKTVVITGATGGFGKALTHKFASAGCSLVLTSRKTDALDALTQNVNTPVHKIILDLTDIPATRQAFASLPAPFQDIDLLVNNAGNAFGLGPAYESSFDDWQNMMAINNNALVAITHTLLPAMVKRRHGHIINISSIAGNYAYPGSSVYGASKAFVTQFSRCLKADLISTKVRVTNIEPGMVETPFSLNRFHGDAERAQAVYANASPLQAEDIAEAVFWASTQPLHVNINHIEVMPVTQGAGPLAVHRG